MSRHFQQTDPWVLDMEEKQNAINNKTMERIEELQEVCRELEANYAALKTRLFVLEYEFGEKLGPIWV